MTFEEIYNKVDKAALKRYVIYLVTNYNEVDDLLQDIWLHVHNNTNKFKIDKCPQKWVFRVARNYIITYMRRKKAYNGFRNIMYVEEYFDSELEQSDYMPDAKIDEYENELKNKQIKRIVETELKGTQLKKVVELRYYEGLKYKDIATKMDLELGSVKGYLNKINKKLEKNEKLKRVCEMY